MAKTACEKCKKVPLTEHHRTYRPAKFSRKYWFFGPKIEVSGEHMERMCLYCNFTWKEPLSSGIPGCRSGLD